MMSMAVSPANKPMKVTVALGARNLSSVRPSRLRRDNQTFESELFSAIISPLRGQL